jgi:hypothetical protein
MIEFKHTIGFREAEPRGLGLAPEYCVLLKNTELTAFRRTEHSIQRVDSYVLFKKRTKNIGSSCEARHSLLYVLTK